MRGLLILFLVMAVFYAFMFYYTSKITPLANRASEEYAKYLIERGL